MDSPTPDEPSNAPPIPPPLAPWELTDEECFYASDRTAEYKERQSMI